MTAYTVAVSALSSALIKPIYSIGLTLFYYDARVRKEGFDLERMLERSSMDSLQPRGGIHRIRGVIKRILLVALTLALPCTPPCTLGQAAAGPLRADQPESVHAASLIACATVAEACAQKPAPRTCDPSLVGPDVMVSIPAGKRTVNFAWLRDALRLAASAETLEEQTKRREGSLAANSVMHAPGWRR